MLVVDQCKLALADPMYAPFWPVDGRTSVKADSSRHLLQVRRRHPYGLSIQIPSLYAHRCVVYCYDFHVSTHVSLMQKYNGIIYFCTKTLYS
jgi:hypothetical protein